MSNNLDLVTLSRDLSRENAELKREVLRLSSKLGTLHATDVNALWRAYRSLTEHAEALHKESSEIALVISSLKTDVVSVEEGAKELTIIGGGLFALNLVRVAAKNSGLVRPTLNLFRTSSFLPVTYTNFVKEGSHMALLFVVLTLSPFFMLFF